MTALQKYLITGFSGFVSRHFLDLLESSGNPVSVLGVDVQTPEFSIAQYRHVKCYFEKTDLLDRTALENAIGMFHPDFVLHLASFSSVAYSWKNPVACFANNTNIFLNLLESIRVHSLPCRILSVGSSEEYGSISERDLPLREDGPVNPLSPYAVARVSQEMFSKVYVKGYGLDIVMTRSFNHIGPGQKEIFVVPSFAKQLVAIHRSGQSHGVLTTGDSGVIRDFVDVRDVVKAYRMLLQCGVKGEIYNICSGQGMMLEEIIRRMAKMLSLRIDLKVDPALLRLVDNRTVVGCYEKIQKAAGWRPLIPMDQSLADILEFWKKNEAAF